MTQEQDREPGNGWIDDGVGTYDVVLLVEHELSRADAAQVHALHEDVTDQVVYHVLLPQEDAGARIEAAMGSLAAGEVMASPAMTMDSEDLETVRRDSARRAATELEESLAHLRAEDAVAHGQVTRKPPVEALAAMVAEVDGREAIVLTSPHVVAEFFHVDWASKARRKLGVPVLHLLEHETLDEQAGGGEGVSGF